MNNEANISNSPADGCRADLSVDLSEDAKTPIETHDSSRNSNGSPEQNLANQPSMKAIETNVRPPTDVSSTATTPELQASESGIGPTAGLPLIAKAMASLTPRQRNFLVSFAETADPRGARSHFRWLATSSAYRQAFEALVAEVTIAELIEARKQATATLCRLKRIAESIIAAEDALKKVIEIIPTKPRARGGQWVTTHLYQSGRSEKPGGLP